MPQSRSVKAMILASGSALTALVGLISAAALSRLLTQEDYATYRQTLLAYTFTAPFLILGLDRALFYFLPIEKQRVRGVLVENLLLLGTGGLLLTLFLLLGGNHLLALRFNNPSLATTLLLLAPYPLLLVPSGALSACLLARDRAAQVAQYNVSSRLIILLTSVLPCVIWPTPTVAIAGLVFGTAARTVTAMTLMFRACNEGDWRPTRHGTWKQIAFSVPLGLTTLLATVSKSLDQVFVAAMCTPAMFAVFVNGAIEIPLIGIITGSVTSVLIVDYAKLYKEGRIDEIVRLIHRAMVKCALILIPAMAFLFYMAPELMRLLYGDRYEGSAEPFRVFLLLLPMRTLTFGAVLMATGNSRYILYQTTLGLTSKVIVTWYAVTTFGPIGAALASVLTTYVVTVPFLSLILKRILSHRIRTLYPWKALTKVSFASYAPLLVLAPISFALQASDLVLLLVNGILYTVLVIVLLSLFGFVAIPELYAQITSFPRRLWAASSQEHSES